MMQTLGPLYVANFNARPRRTGTLWEGRYRSCLVGSRRHVLACHRYSELNPVSTAIVPAPADYAWSSCRVNASDGSDPLLHRHPAYLALGPTSPERAQAHRALFDDALSAEAIAEIRSYPKQRALGTDRFRAVVERKLGRCASVPRASTSLAATRPLTRSSLLTGRPHVVDEVGIAPSRGFGARLRCVLLGRAELLGRWRFLHLALPWRGFVQDRSFVAHPSNQLPLGNCVEKRRTDSVISFASVPAA